MLTENQRRVLNVCPAPVTQMAHALGERPSAVRKVCKALERKGLVTFKDDKTTLTQSGKAEVPNKLRRWEAAWSMCASDTGATKEEIAANLACTTTAAYSLIQDVRRKGHQISFDKNTGRFHV